MPCIPIWTLPAATLILSGDRVNRVNGFIDAGYLTGYGSSDLLNVVYDSGTDRTIVTASSPFQLTITPNGANPGNYDFEWDSQADKLYDLVSSTDLSTAPDTWAVWDNQAGIASGGTTTSLPNIPGGGDPARFFAVVRKDPPPPPLLNGSFESPGAGSFPPADDWAVHNPAGVPIGVGDVATYQPGDAPDGNWAGSILVPSAASPATADYGFSQVLGVTFAADTDYVADMQLRDGSVSGASGAAYKIQLVSGGTILAEDDNSVVLPTTWSPRAISYTGTTVSGPVPSPGDPLELRILIKAGATTDQAVDCDAVTFTVTGP